MSDYPLADLAEFTQSREGERIGLLIKCPTCGARGGIHFAGTNHAASNPGPVWNRTGETLEAMSCSPSVLMHGHYHGWIKDGKLCVDAYLGCKKEEPNA